MKLTAPALLLLAIFGVTSADAQTAPVPTVRSVKGNALVKKVKAQDDREARALREGEGLNYGWWVKCGQGCQELQITYCSYHTKRIPRNSAWIRIIHVPCNPSSGGTIGGGAKGEPSIIAYPRENEVVRPETFYVRWDTGKRLIRLGISIKILLGPEIWSPSDVNWKAGFYEAEPLKERLKKEQQAKRLNLILIPTAYNGRQPEPIVFSLISPDEERDLNAKLESFEDESDEILRAIARGFTFHEFKLYADVALELEKALTLVQSRKANKAELEWAKRLAITANESANNGARVKQLCSSLRTSDSPPAPCYKRDGHEQ